MPSQPYHTRSGGACQAAEADLWATEVVPHVPGDLQAQARTLGAFTRRRMRDSATDLLRGLRAYVLLSSSFRHLGAWAVVNDVADISAVAWQKRLVTSRPWLAWLVGELLAVPAPAPTLRLVPHTEGNILLVDATRWAQIGGRGDDGRFPLAYNFTVGRLAEVSVTDTHGGEHLGYYRLQPNDLIVADGGYGYRASVATVRKQQAHLITRIRPQTFPFERCDGQSLEIVAQLRFAGPNVREWAGWCPAADGERYAVRLIAAKLPAHEVRKAQARARRNAQKDGRTIQPETLLVAGWALLITTLPTSRWSAEAVLRVYRVRWQVEIVFPQVTKADMSTGLGGRNDVADLHLVVGDDHTVDEQFDHLAALREGGLLQAHLEPFTDRLDGWDRLPHLEQLLAVVVQLTGLPLEVVPLLHQLPLAPLKLGQFHGFRQIGRQQALALAIQAA